MPRQKSIVLATSRSNRGCTGLPIIRIQNLNDQNAPLATSTVVYQLTITLNQEPSLSAGQAPLELHLVHLSGMAHPAR